MKKELEQKEMTKPWPRPWFSFEPAPIARGCDHLWALVRTNRVVRKTSYCPRVSALLANPLFIHCESVWRAHAGKARMQGNMKRGSEKQRLERTAPEEVRHRYLFHHPKAIASHASGHVKNEDDVFGADGGGQIPRPGQPRMCASGELGSHKHRARDRHRKRTRPEAGVVCAATLILAVVPRPQNTCTLLVACQSQLELKKTKPN